IFLRNRQVLFWTLAFPIFLMVMLGSFLGNGNGMSVSIGVVDQDQSLQSKEFLFVVKKSEAIDLQKENSKDKVIEQLKNGDIQLVVIIPKGYGNSLMSPTAGSKPFSIPVYYNEMNVAVSEVGLPLVN